ncbi:MAG TPA: FG-GAP-like repeat-containing protein [Planctomycetota bacterium]|nr:FG-GAP-like repeat-containing protein [Planctomycetota bacterium]
MDLHGDGNLDLISGSWPGEIFLFRGGPGRTFAAPEMIKDKTGEIIDIGGGVQETGDEILVTGNGDFEETPEGTVIKLHGKTIKIPKGKQGAITGTASSVHAFDWNGDGLIDLLVGDIEGNVWLIPNEGTKKEPAWGKHEHLAAGGAPLKVEGDAGPFVADWDGDGLPDLIVGAGDGSVTFFKNTGTREKPVLAKGEVLVPPSTMDWEHAPGEPRPGVRAKVCVVDWNGDGRLDLLVGDYAHLKPKLPDFTPEQKAEHEKLKAELAELEKKWEEGYERITKAKDDAESKKLSDELRPVRERLSAIRAKLPPESESHGWVWLYARKPAATKKLYR